MDYSHIRTPSSLPFQALPFDKIGHSELLPALEKSIEKAHQKLQAWKKINDDSFSHVILALDEVSEEVSQVSTIFHNLYSAHATEELQKDSQKISDLLTNFQNELVMDDDVFQKVKKCYETLWQTDKLNKEEKRILKKTYDDFSRNGALLNAAQKEVLKKIDEELSQLGLKFSDNVLKATKAFTLVISNEKDLAGLPDSAISQSKEEALRRQLNGYVFTLDYHSYGPFMKYSAQRDLRKKMYLAYAQRGNVGETNNTEIVTRILKLKLQRAQLLGRQSHAQYVLEQRMAQDESTVQNFLDQFYDRSFKAASREIAELQNIATQDGIADLQKWDISFYSERLKEKNYSFNEEELRPYLALENVLSGLFKTVSKLYNITFKLRSDLPVYAEHVQVYEVNNIKGEFQSLLYLDLFPRATKKQGAWMTSFREQGYQFHQENVRPHICIVCNFPQASGGKPALLTWNDTLTLYHEFGHALHGMLSQCQYKILSGTNVYWDFVELPSQIMENWAKAKECLKEYAHHYQTQQSIPEALIDKLIKADKFQAGLMSLRQLSFGQLDFAYHSIKRAEDIPSNLQEFERKTVAKFSFLKPLAEECMTNSFSHIFAGGYSAGYYSYKWAEVLDADAFSFFKEQGIFNPQTALSFKENILEKGGTEDPMVLYKKFRTRAPDVNALLDRLGL